MFLVSHTLLFILQDKKAFLVIHAYVDKVMEGVAKHLNMTIPAYVPISPFKETDAPPIILDPVKFEETDRDCHEDSKLIKNNVKDTCDSNETHNAINLQISAQKTEKLSSPVKNEEGKLSIIEGTQSELKCSSTSNQPSVNNLYKQFGDSHGCSASLQHERGAVCEDVRMKHENLESHACEYPEVPSKKIKYNHNASI